MELLRQMPPRCPDCRYSDQGDHRRTVAVIEEDEDHVLVATMCPGIQTRFGKGCTVGRRVKRPGLSAPEPEGA